MERFELPKPLKTSGLQPLTTHHRCRTPIIPIQSREQVSNLQPIDYKSIALPIELSRHFNSKLITFEPMIGFEPMIYGFADRRLRPLSHIGILLILQALTDSNSHQRFWRPLS